ncbi:MAG: triose-phosphate isomerase, partial [Janthinobacterium lividum]
MTTRPRLIAGNWKMNGTAAGLAEIAAMAAAVADLPAATDARMLTVAVCPPATLIDRARSAAGTGPLVIGAQDVHAEPHGAFTGSVSVAMLADAGASLVIDGHS